MRPLRILTWHVHGSYLFYLGHTPHRIYVPVREGRPSGYSGLPPGPFPWPATMREVPAEEVRNLPLDCVLYQSRGHYEVDRFELLSTSQRRLPSIFLEHDPPREHPTDTRHVVDDPGTLLVQVTPFNALMWSSGRSAVRVIEHGVVVPEGVHATYELPRAIAVVNHLTRRGRRLGADILDDVRRRVPVDLVGLEAELAGGVGEIPHDRLPAFAARYRAFFNPIRYTSLGLAVCEAMMVGLPVVALATTELPTVIENGVTGWVDTRPDRLAERLASLLADPALARRLGQNARRYARHRFGLDRFLRDWNDAFAFVTGAVGSPGRTHGLAVSPAGASS
jgi:glycosyltransferase involved in cell wall biosynthesis